MSERKLLADQEELLYEDRMDGLRELYRLKAEIGRLYETMSFRVLGEKYGVSESTAERTFVRVRERKRKKVDEC